MDFKKLIPDFNALKSVDWLKPEVSTKDILSIVALSLSGLMIIFIFLPWFGIEATWHGEHEQCTRLGITIWYGVFAFIFTIIAGVAALYKQHSLAFCASVLCLLFGFIGLVSYTSLVMDDTYMTAAKIKSDLKIAELVGMDVNIIRYGAILYFIAALGSTAVNFLKATGVDVSKYIVMPE
jgi:hypothetical protein